MKTTLIKVGIMMLCCTTLQGGTKAFESPFSMLDHLALAAEFYPEILANSVVAESFTRPGQRGVAHPDSASWRGDLLAGAAEVDITFPLGAPLAGYGGRFSLVFFQDATDDPYDYATLFAPNQGAHDRLKAQALILDDGERQVCLVALDAIGVSVNIHELVVQRCQDLGFDYSNLMIFASHTHSGPGAVSIEPLWWFMTADLYKPELETILVDKLERAVRQAYANKVPAALGFGEALTEGLTRNRRGLPDWDQVVRVLRIDNVETGDLLAVMFNFAVHGTAQGDENCYYSGDFPGGARRALAAGLEGNPIVLFANAAEGDVAPRFSGWTGIEEGGQALANYVLDLIPTISVESTVVVSYAGEVFSLPEPYVRPGLEIPEIPLDWTIPMTGLLYPEALFQAFIINDKVLVSVPGEPITAVGRMIQQAVIDLGLSEPLVIGCANHHKAYIVDAQEYWNGGYESVACFFGPEAGQIFTDADLAMVEAAMGW